MSEIDPNELRTLHRDSYPMGNIHHGTPESPDWGTFCVECKQSWPCDVSELLDIIDKPTTPAAHPRRETEVNGETRP